MGRKTLSRFGMSNKSKGTYYIETYGCQMNEHDSEKMAALLDQLGMTPVGAADGADVVVINTCSIREKAEHKVYSALGRLKPLKAKNPGMVTVVAGCVAQQERERLLKRADHLDIVLGTHCISELKELIERTRTSGKRVNRTEFHSDAKCLHMAAPAKGRSAVCSYVTIMQGCSNFCAYCVVPFTRGPEQSRPSASIAAEVRDLADKGIREITLLGQNVNAYGKDRPGEVSFAELLDMLEGIPRLARIRFTTSHPKDLTPDLVEAMARLGKVCEHIHLPLQSGSDRILAAMGRGYTIKDYLHKIHSLRDRIQGVAITADMIVGFPGETEEDFRETLSALEEVRFDQIFSFKYSPRPGTAAAKFRDQIVEQTKAERLARVHELQERITGEYHETAVGSTEEILIEGLRPGSGQAFGRTRTNKIVNLESSENVRIGELVGVRITRGLKHSLTGALI